MRYQVLAHQHIFQPGRWFAQCHASTVCHLPDGSLGAAWFGGDHEKAPNVAIWFSKCPCTGDHAGRWTDPVKIADRENIPCWNPVLLADGDRLLLFYKVGNEIPAWQTMVKVSLDSGGTWSEAQDAVPGDFGGRGPVKNKCIRLKDGTLLAPASTEAGGWNAFTDRSEDGGETWHRSADVPLDRSENPEAGIIQPTLWEDESGAVHMLARSNTGYLYRSDSADGGRSWSAARKTQLPNNNCGVDLVRMESGRLVLVYNPVSGNWAARTPIAFSVSEDNGETWTEPEILSHQPCDRNAVHAEFSYPAVIAEGEDVHITYTWKRQTIAYWYLRFL